MKTHKDIKKQLKLLLRNYEQLLRVIKYHRQKFKSKQHTLKSQDQLEKVRIGLKKMTTSKAIILREIKDLTIGKQSVNLSEAIYENTLRSIVVNIKTLNEL